MREEGVNLLWETKTEAYCLLSGYDIHDSRMVQEEATLDPFQWYKSKVIPRKLSQPIHLPYDDARIEGKHYPDKHPEDNPNTLFFYATELYPSFFSSPLARIRLYCGFNKRPLWNKTLGDLVTPISRTSYNVSLKVMGNNSLVIYQGIEGEIRNLTNGFISIVGTDETHKTYTTTQIMSAITGANDTWHFRGPAITQNAVWLTASPDNGTGGYRLVRLTQSGITTFTVPLGTVQASIVGLRDKLLFLYSKPEGPVGGGDYEGIFLRKFNDASPITPDGGEIQVMAASEGEVIAFGGYNFNPLLFSEGSVLIQIFGGSTVFRIKYDGTVLTTQPDGEPFSNYGNRNNLGEGLFELPGVVIDIDQYGYWFKTDETRNVRLNRITASSIDNYFWDVPRVAITGNEGSLKYRMRMHVRSSTGIAVIYPWHRFTEKLLMVPILARANPPVINGLPSALPPSINVFNKLPALCLEFYDLRLGFKYASILLPKQVATIYLRDPHFNILTT